jgi:hypothetical protein
MRVSVFGAGVLFALVTTLSPLSAGPALAQTVDELVAKHIEARGGYEKLKAIDTLKITRTIATPFTSVEVVTYKKRPNLLRIEQTPKGQTTAIPRGVNAAGAWDVAQGKVMLRPEPLAIEGREIDGDFDGLLVDWKEKGHTVTYEGREKVGTTDTHKLKVTTKSGVVREVYLDAATYLEAQIVGKVRLPQMDPKTKDFRYNDTILTFSDYRKVEGVMFPFAIDEERTGGPITQSLATFTSKIEVNVPMEDSLFEAPSQGAGK